MITAVSGDVTAIGVDDEGVTFVEFNGPSGVTLSLSDEQRLALLAALSETVLQSAQQGRTPISLHLERMSARPFGDGREVVLDFLTAGGWTVSLLTPRAGLPLLRAAIQQVEAAWDTPSTSGMN